MEMREGESGMNGDSCMETYAITKKKKKETYAITTRKIASQWEFAVCLRELKQGQPRGLQWSGKWEGGSRGWAHMSTYD